MTGADQTTAAAGGVPAQTSTEAELIRLRAQVAELQAQVPGGPGRRATGWGRPGGGAGLREPDPPVLV